MPPSGCTQHSRNPRRQRTEDRARHVLQLHVAKRSVHSSVMSAPGGARLLCTLLAGTSLPVRLDAQPAPTHWDGLELPRADPLDCAAAKSFIPASCQDLSGGATCLRAVGGCPEGCVEDDDTNGCSGTKQCPPPTEFSFCELGCEFVPALRVMCPVGCRAQGNSDTCIECTADYAPCGAYGGCDARPLREGDVEHVPAEGEPGDQLVCTCLPGFTGSLCHVKEFGVAGWGLGITWMLFCVGVLCMLKSRDYFFSTPWTWKYSDYEIVPIFGLVLHSEVLFITLEYLQLLGFAFGDSVPWPDEWAPDTFSTRVVRIVKFITRTIWPQVSCLHVFVSTPRLRNRHQCIHVMCILNATDTASA